MLALLYAAGPIGATALHDFTTVTPSSPAWEGHHDTDCSICLWHSTAQCGPELHTIPIALPVDAEPAEAATEVALASKPNGSHRERAPPLL